MAIAGIEIGQNDQRALFSNLDMAKVNIPKICYDGLVRYLLFAKMNAQNKLKSDRHIVTSRLRNSIYVQHNSNNNKQSKSYSDNEGKTFNAEMSVPLRPDEAAFGTNVDYAEKIERLDSFIYWGFKNADNKEFSKEYNRQINGLKSKLK
jgi:hypothetical protein